MADILFVMMYDTRSQIFDACIAGANAGLPDVNLGAQQWIDVGVPALTLVLGLPWLAFTYPCQHLSADGRFCTLAHTEYQGVNCSDAAGSDSSSFADAMTLLAQNSSAAGWDAATATPYINYQKAGKPMQMWFDDPRSLMTKYAVVQELGLRGVGAYTLEGLDYSSARSRNESAEMWAALHESNVRKTDDTRTMANYLHQDECPSPHALEGFCATARAVSVGHCLMCITDKFRGACNPTKMESFCNGGSGPPTPAGNCPCVDTKLCKPLPGPLPAKIVMPIHGAPNVKLEPTPAKFWGADWRFDLTTTIGWGTGMQQDICYAHARGVRVVGCIGVSIVSHTNPTTPFCPSGGTACPGNPTQDEWSAMLTNASARSEFVAGQYRNAPPGLDGWSIDVEGSKSHGRELTLLLRELRSVGQATNPNIQLSFFMPWHPGSDDYPWWKEAFDLPGLTEVNDYLVTMSCEWHLLLASACKRMSDAALVGCRRYELRLGQCCCQCQCSTYQAHGWYPRIHFGGRSTQQISGWVALVRLQLCLHKQHGRGAVHPQHQR